MFGQDRRTIFPISTHAELGKVSQKQKLLKIIEFKQIYESLAAYIALQFESELNQETAIKIKGIDFWPESNYASKYLNEGLYLRYGDRGRWVFESDVRQWERLHSLAISSKKTYTKDKANFNITDASINELFDIEVESIRYLLLSYNIPIKIKGIKTIDKVYIHTVSLVEALKKEIKDKYLNGRRDSYKHLIAYLYDNHLSSEKLHIVASQKNIFIENFIIQSGDILQLKNGQIVVTNKIEIGKNNSVYITYAILKADLQLSSRNRTVLLDQIEYVLKGNNFIEYKNYTPSKRIILLKKWMIKRMIKIDPKIFFKPNLTLTAEDFAIQLLSGNNQYHWYGNH